MELANSILNVLADNRFHSGEVLARLFKVSRAAIWKSVNKLRDYGLDIHSVTGRGYCLSGKIELLHAETILARLSPSVQKTLDNIVILNAVNSTNTYLSKHVVNTPVAVLAEQQTQGKGRNNRNWLSPYGRNIYLSLSWRYNPGTASLAGLSLVIGIAVIKALKKFNIEHLKLKWPNDIFYKDKKLGGILVEMQGEAQGPLQIIVGVGINISSSKDMHSIDQAWTSLADEGYTELSRNRIASELITALVNHLQQFETREFIGFMSEWQQYDYLRNKPIYLIGPKDKHTGIMSGVNNKGHLLVRCNEKIHQFHSGEVSVRLDTDI